MSNVNALRMRFLPRFPARISGTNGLTVEVDSPDLIVKPDFGSLAEIVTVETPSDTYFWVMLPNGLYARISFQMITDGVGDIIIGPNLIGLSEISSGADKVPYFIDNAGNASSFTMSEFVRDLSSSASDSAYRAALGLGGASTLDVGTTVGTVAAGNDSRITGAAQKSVYDPNNVAADAFDSLNQMFLQAGTDAVARSVRAKLRDRVSVKDFGAVGDGVADDTDALQAARDYIAAQTDPPILVFPAGTYAYTTSPNWAISYANIVADGEVVLKHTGSGTAVLIDSGAYPASGKLDMFMDRFIVAGNANTTIGAYVRAVHHSQIGLNIRCGTTFALYGEFCVCTVFPNLIISNNHGPWTSGTYPATGVFLNKRNTNEEMSYCLFPNPIIEGCGIGVEMSWSLGCIFFGGTIEGNYTEGVHIYPDSRRNKFIAVDFEFNDRTDESTVAAGDDVVCQGYQNELIFCDGDGEITFSSGAEDNKVVGGEYNKISVESGALRTRLMDTGYNRFGDGSLTVSDTSTVMRVLSNVAGEYVHDAKPANTAITVGASPWAYTNTTGNACTITLSGGTISYFGFRNNLPSGVAEFGVTRIPSVFRLEPNQGINIIYTDVPTITRHDF